MFEKPPPRPQSFQFCHVNPFVHHGYYAKSALRRYFFLFFFLRLDPRRTPARYLAAWLVVFPVRQFLVLDHARLAADPAAVLSETAAFLGLARFDWDVSRVYNTPMPPWAYDDAAAAAAASFHRTAPAAGAAWDAAAARGAAAPDAVAAARRVGGAGCEIALHPKTAAVLRRRPFASSEAVGVSSTAAAPAVAAPAAAARRGCRGCRAWGGATSAAAAPPKARTSAGVRRIVADLLGLNRAVVAFVEVFFMTKCASRRRQPPRPGPIHARTALPMPLRIVGTRKPDVDERAGSAPPLLQACSCSNGAQGL